MAKETIALWHQWRISEAVKIIGGNIESGENEIRNGVRRRRKSERLQQWRHRGMAYAAAAIWRRSRKQKQKAQRQSGGAAAQRGVAG